MSFCFEGIMRELSNDESNLHCSFLLERAMPVNGKMQNYYMKRNTITAQAYNEIIHTNTCKNGDYIMVSGEPTFNGNVVEINLSGSKNITVMKSIQNPNFDKSTK